MLISRLTSDRFIESAQIIMTFLGVEATNTSFLKAALIEGILTNLIAFGVFFGVIGYFVFTGPLFGKGKENG